MVDILIVWISWQHLLVSELQGESSALILPHVYHCVLTCCSIVVCCNMCTTTTHKYNAQVQCTSTKPYHGNSCEKQSMPQFWQRLHVLYFTQFEQWNIEVKWMVFQATVCAILGWRQAGLMRWILVWNMPQVQDQLLDLLTCSPTRYHCVTAAPYLKRIKVFRISY